MQQKDTISSIEDIVRYYQEINPEKDLYVGLELERSGVYADSLEPVPYAGNNGYLAVYKKLVEELGWEIEEKDDECIYELRRGETRITIEGDGRPELSGSPMKNLHDLTREFRLHDNELMEIGKYFNIDWLPLGWQPLHEAKEIPMLKKNPYQIYMQIETPEWMGSFLQLNNGIHVNCGYIDEENAIKKAKTAFRIAPIIGAMFASSPFSNAKRAASLDMRRDWYHSREGNSNMEDIPLTILSHNFSFAEWIKNLLQKPVTIIHTDIGDIQPSSLSFIDWMNKGYDDRFPTIKDFDWHIKTIWSDIRLRPGYLECRSADSVPTPLAMSCTAITKGLLLSSASWEAVELLTRDWSYDDILDINKHACTSGLQTKIGNKSLLSYAQELIVIANESLHRLNNLDASGNDESIYLAPLKEQIFIKEKSPAEELVYLWENDWNNDVRRIVEWCKQQHIVTT